MYHQCGYFKSEFLALAFFPGHTAAKLEPLFAAGFSPLEKGGLRGI
jgi:hypothetical protein